MMYIYWYFSLVGFGENFLKIFWKMGTNKKHRYAETSLRICFRNKSYIFREIYILVSDICYLEIYIFKKISMSINKIGLSLGLQRQSQAIL